MDFAENCRRAGLLEGQRAGALFWRGNRRRMLREDLSVGFARRLFGGRGSSLFFRLIFHEARLSFLLCLKSRECGLSKTGERR